MKIPVGKSLLALGGFAATVVAGAWIEKTWKDYKARQLEKQLKAEFMEPEYDYDPSEYEEDYDYDEETGKFI